MKLVSLALLGTLITTVRSDVFSYSSGWKPGQTIKPPEPTQTVSSGSAGGRSGGRFSWSSLLASGPVGSLLSRAGVNLTQRLEEAQRKAADLPWDDRIPMIRDDNFEDLIINQRFATPEEEESAVWFILVTSTSSQRTGISPVIDEQFNEAYTTSLDEQDLPDVRWGRIDYFNVTRLTTKWAVWRAPLLIVAKNRGKTLRFFYPQQIGAKASQLREFLLEETWQRRDPWSGRWAPGGSQEELLDKFAVFQEKLYNFLTKIPRWMYLIVSGGIGSVLIQVLHPKPKPTSGEKARAAPLVQPAHSKEQEQEQEQQSTVPSSVDQKKAGPQKRKGSKK